MVMPDSARRAVPVPRLARWLLGLGIAATLAANVEHGHGLVGAAIALGPAVARVGSSELLSDDHPQRVDTNGLSNWTANIRC